MYFRLAVIIAMLCLCGCVHYAPNEYQITTLLNGVPQACTIVATSNIRTTSDYVVKEVTLETDPNGRLSYMFPNSSQWTLEFFDAAGTAYPATTKVRPRARGETVTLTIELTGTN